MECFIGGSFMDGRIVSAGISSYPRLIIGDYAEGF